MGSCSSSNISTISTSRVLPSPPTPPSPPSPPPPSPQTSENTVQDVEDIEEIKKQVIRPDGSVDPRFIIDFNLLTTWDRIYPVEQELHSILQDLDRRPRHTTEKDYVRCMEMVRMARELASPLLANMLTRGDPAPFYLQPPPIDFSPWKQYLSEKIEKSVDLST